MNGFVLHFNLNFSNLCFSDIQLDRPKSMRHRSRTCISLFSGWTLVCWFHPFLTVVRTNAQNIEFNLEPLPSSDYEYIGPTVDNVNSCRCSSVYYSLLSACAYCQGRNYLGLLVSLQRSLLNSIFFWLSGGQATTPIVQLSLSPRASKMNHSLCSVCKHAFLSATTNKSQLESRYQLMHTRMFRYNIFNDVL